MKRYLMVGVLCVFLVFPWGFSGKNKRRLSNHIKQIHSLYNRSMAPGRAQKYMLTLLEGSRDHNLQWSLVYAIAWTESDFLNYSNGYDARGIMQVRPVALRHMGYKVEQEFVGWKWKKYIRAGIKYFAWCTKNYPGDQRFACYHAGPGKVDRNDVPRSTYFYIREVKQKSRIIRRWARNHR